MADCWRGGTPARAQVFPPLALVEASDLQVQDDFGNFSFWKLPVAQLELKDL